jgi:hypothetical protein
MDWVKKNVFLVVLVGVTVLLVGLILFVNSTVAASVEEAVQKRDRINSELRRFARGQEYNRAVINARQAEVTGSKENLGSVIERTRQFNNRYKVLSLRRPDDQGVVDAFPFNRELDRQILLRAVFPKAYMNAIEKIRGSLNPTTPPTEQVDEAQLNAWAQRVLMEKRSEWTKAVKAGTIEPEDEEGRSTMPVMSEEIRQIALERLTRDRMVNRARAGEIYVDAGALQPLVDPTERRPLLESMWFAQLSLWLYRDVTDAINQTNAEAFEGLPRTQRSVPNAAVKRLVSIRMPRQYVTPAAATDQGTGGTGGTMVAATLTESLSNRDYDVIHYAVTVVMPYRYLGRLEWHLAEENLHTVLQLQEMVAERNQPGSYYYGAEPVVRATLRVEWKLLTEWERPLMPVEVLGTLPSDALRPEDQQRVDEAGGGTATGGGRPAREGRSGPRERRMFGEER